MAVSKSLSYDVLVNCLKTKIFPLWHRGAPKLQKWESWQVGGLSCGAARGQICTGSPGMRVLQGGKKKGCGEAGGGGCCRSH